MTHTHTRQDVPKVYFSKSIISNTIKSLSTLVKMFQKRNQRQRIKSFRDLLKLLISIVQRTHKMQYTVLFASRFQRSTSPPRRRINSQKLQRKKRKKNTKVMNCKEGEMITLSCSCFTFSLASSSFDWIWLIFSTSSASGTSENKTTTTDREVNQSNTCCFRDY